MLISEEVCGNCKWSELDYEDETFFCDNMHSDFFTKNVLWDRSCEFWEEEDDA